MSKEAPEYGLGKRFEIKSSTWKSRKGKTQRDKETGAWANHRANKAATADANRRGPQPVRRKKA
ncbi:MAG TPA: hypothetical protein VIV12_00840 [Streptosporangiaceae bacterium]